MSPRQPARSAGPGPLTVALDLAALARLTRLVTKDTFPPVRRAREWVTDRFPEEGKIVQGAPWVFDEESRTISRLGRFGPVWAGATRLPGPGNEETYLVNDPHPVGELLTCPWCASVWLAGGVLILRRLLPGFWDPVARVLAGSLAAGIAAHAE